MPTASTPVLGVALPVDGLVLHRGWIIESQRDLEIQDFFQSDVLDGDWRPLADRIRGLLDGHRGRLGIHGPFWGFKIDSHDSAIRAVVTKRFMQGLDVCAALGATQMVIHSPYTTWDHNNLDANAGSREGVIERVRLTLAEVLKRAESMGVTLVVENIEDKNPAERVALVKAIGSPALRISIDTGHAHYAHVSTGAPPVDMYVSAAGDLLEHVHLQDSEGYADRHWHPGEGTIRWESVFTALGKLTSNPRLILEVKDKENARKGAVHLASLGLAA